MEGMCEATDAETQPLEYFLDLGEVIALKRDINDLTLTNPAALQNESSTTLMRREDLDRLAAAIGASPA